MRLSTFEELLSAFGIKNEAISNFDIERIDSDISIIPFEVEMRDEIPESINEDDCNIIVNIHSTDGTRWIRKAGGVYCFEKEHIVI